jgi:succinate dehydrogenase flavin-adding protein (antitoxin of CptAB toxin-antitoxin module)
MSEFMDVQWPVRPDTAATRVDELLSYAETELLDLVYRQRGVSRAARQELARKIGEVMERARARAAREVEA